ncbi:hypothetical protein [Streptomyces sp.]|uniref:hypothetical protein n=1 Tax=Streptomyces sp. TaxID=1931 RepID=UPI0028110D8E|nr:hypothetical protein [Streptomyces sp.]
MGDEVPRTLRDPRAEPVCPACGGPLDMVATRHKVLGAWVPEWKVQPCRAAGCGGGAAQDAPGSGRGARDARSAPGAE